MSEALANEGTQAVEGTSRPLLLRTAREAAGLHIAALAAALKVPVRKLEALEAGRYSELPDLTFARALASSACRHLKIDPAPVLEQIPQGAIPELGGSRQAINTPFQPAHDPAPLNPLGWLSRPALLAAIVLLLGALVIVFMPRLEETAQVEAGSVVTPVETVEPVAAVEPEPAQEPAVPATPVVEGAAQAEPAAPAAPAPPAAIASPVETAPAAATSPAPNTSSLLTIAATGESWVEVTNGSGSVVIQRVLQAGDAVDFSSTPPYTVVLGRAEVAQVTVRGKPFDVSRFVRNNVARFEVK
ncbi:RodZ domain-containing protein [Hydrogenophaga laconesensis]|uniref:Cytoskeleton protein RodZ n=1 Tax=Hydrogenophaga laconesensis TaxID=1805971 RepID=A0ABU1V4S3_9BURK|nr:RodZ domain-containing protein [Hydrogenophaga laconesensis]MDR7092457.1 cytoskeleton protein RodZ [Hydrogenophaga laconesensis]